MLKSRIKDTDTLATSCCCYSIMHRLAITLNFMNRIVLPVHRSHCEGYLAFLPKLYQERNEDACLEHALLSVSYLTLSHEQNHKLNIEAQKNHGISLRLLKTALESQDSVTKDELFANIS